MSAMNADQQITVISIIAGSAVGLAGIVATGLGGWRDRASARTLAETARKQQRLADAYVDALALAATVGYWASRLRPVIAGPDYQPPGAPPEQEQIRVGATVLTFGSQEVKARWKSWQQAVQDIVGADLKVRLRLDAAERHKYYQPKKGDDAAWRDPLTPWAKIVDEYVPAEAAARESLIEQVAKELAI